MHHTAFLAPVSLGSSSFRNTRSHVRFFTHPVTGTARRLTVRGAPLRRCEPSCSANVGESKTSVPPSVASLTWAVGNSKEYKVVDAVKEAVARASATISRAGVDVSMVFLFVNSRAENTPDDEMRRVVPVTRKTLAMRRVLASNTLIFGCSSAAYANPDEEPTVTAALVHFPTGTDVKTFKIGSADNFDIDWKQEQWHDFVGVPPPKGKSDEGAGSADGVRKSVQIFLLQHPDFSNMKELLAGLDFAYPGVPKLGARAGRVNPLHEAYLFDADGLIEQGVIGVAISSSDMQIDVTVSQGARGVGPLLEVMEVREGSEITNVREIGTAIQAQAPPMILLDMWAQTESISDEDRVHASRYLLFGVEVDKVADIAKLSMSPKPIEETDAKGKPIVPEVAEPLDMVICKVVAFNNATKSLTIEGSHVRLGSRVQFQIRDEEAARAELMSLFDKLQLEGSSRAMDGMAMMGALLLVDTERGANLYGTVTADLDRTLYSERFPVPISVLSSEGQLGPLPSGGLTGAAGNTFTLSASALYISVYGRVQPSPGADSVGA